MKITFPTNFEKKHLLLLVKKQNYILFLGMKFAFIHPKIHEIFSQIKQQLTRACNLEVKHPGLNHAIETGRLA